MRHRQGTCCRRRAAAPRMVCGNILGRVRHAPTLALGRTKLSCRHTSTCFAASPLSLRSLHELGSGAVPLVEFGQFTQDALAGRLALAVAQLDGLPHGLHRRKPIKRLRKSYSAAIKELTTGLPDGSKCVSEEVTGDRTSNIPPCVHPSLPAFRPFAAWCALA